MLLQLCLHKKETEKDALPLINKTEDLVGPFLHLSPTVPCSSRDMPIRRLIMNSPKTEKTFTAVWSKSFGDLRTRAICINSFWFLQLTVHAMCLLDKNEVNHTDRKRASLCNTAVRRSNGQFSD